jgi:predicted metal-dependent enzyme (double-stranded beta helix superfamily)
MEIVKQRLTLNDFIEAIKTTSCKLELAQLKDWVTKLDLRNIAIEPSICFSCEHYQRQLLYRDSSFEIILVCWKPGQFSPIHNHGDSLNVTRVYRGTLTSRIFADNDLTTEKYSPKLVEEKYLQKDELAEVNRFQIHQLANTSTENLVTFNVYAKPLEQMRV